MSKAHHAQGKRIRWHGVWLVVVLCCVACSHLPLSSGAGGVPRPTWHIGLVGAAYGPGSLEGSFTGDAAALAVDAINQGGGITWHGATYQLALSYGSGDIAGQVSQVTSATPPIVALLGPDESGPALAASPIAARTNIPELTIATADGLTDPSQRAPAQRLWRVRPPDVQWARALVHWLLASGSAHGLALAFSANAYGHAGERNIQAALTSAGVAAPPEVTLPSGLPDPTAAVTDLLASHPAAIICWSPEPEAAALVQALRDAHWQGQLYIGAVDVDFIALAGQAGEGTIGPTNRVLASSVGASQAFFQAFQRRFGIAPDEHAAAMYDAVHLLAAALATVGPDPQAITGYLNQVQGLPGLQGLIDARRASATLGTVGDLLIDLQIVRVDHAEPVVVRADAT